MNIFFELSILNYLLNSYQVHWKLRIYIYIYICRDAHHLLYMFSVRFCFCWSTITCHETHRRSVHFSSRELRSEIIFPELGLPTRVLTQCFKDQANHPKHPGSHSSRPAVPPASQAWVPQAKSSNQAIYRICIHIYIYIFQFIGCIWCIVHTGSIPPIRLIN